MEYLDNWIDICSCQGKFRVSKSINQLHILAHYGVSCFAKIETVGKGPLYPAHSYLCAQHIRKIAQSQVGACWKLNQFT